MSNQETLQIVGWAVDLANRCNVGVQGVISSFISANSELRDIDKAKAFVEKETKEMGMKNHE